MITSTKIDKIQAKLKRAIAEIEKEENVTISFGGISYTAAYYTTQMKVTTLEKNEKVSNVLLATCKALGFTQNIIGMTFQGKNGTMRITDIKTRNRKYPIIAESLVGGKSFKYGKEFIKTQLGGDKIINRNANLDKLVN